MHYEEGESKNIFLKNHIDMTKEEYLDCCLSSFLQNNLVY